MMTSTTSSTSNITSTTLSITDMMQYIIQLSDFFTFAILFTFHALDTFAKSTTTFDILRNIKLLMFFRSFVTCYTTSLSFFSTSSVVAVVTGKKWQYVMKKLSHLMSYVHTKVLQKSKRTLEALYHTSTSITTSITTTSAIVWSDEMLTVFRECCLHETISVNSDSNNSDSNSVFKLKVKPFLLSTTTLSTLSIPPCIHPIQHSYNTTTYNYHTNNNNNYNMICFLFY